LRLAFCLCFSPLVLLISEHVLKKLLAWGTSQIDEAPRQKLEVVLEESHVYRARLDRVLPKNSAEITWRIEP
jgi:hypothetical protein